MTVTLEEYIEGTAANARSSLKTHLEHAAVLRQISDTFESALHYLGSSPEGVVVFVGMAHADFLASARLALGGELPASFASGRSCVENALYAFFLFRHPELTPVWAARHENEDAKKRVRREFQLGAMTKALTTYIEKVGNQVELAYETAIDMGAHPNVMKVFANLSPSDEGAHEWQYINLANMDVGIALRSAAMCGLAALNTFKEIWPITFGSDDVVSTLAHSHHLFIALPDAVGSGQLCAASALGRLPSGHTRVILRV